MNTNGDETSVDSITFSIDINSPNVTLSHNHSDNTLVATDTFDITATFNEPIYSVPTSGLLMHFPFNGNTNEIVNSTGVNARNPQYGQDRNGQTNNAYYFPEITTLTSVETCQNYWIMTIHIPFG